MNGPLAARLAYLLVAVSPLIAAAVAAPVVDSAVDSTPATAVQPRAVEPRSIAPMVTSPDVALREAEQRVVERLDVMARQTHFAVSVLDEETGARFDHGSGRFRTASLVKIHLAALALWRASRSDTVLSDAQREDVRTMLVRSDNEAALRTYFALGGAPAIEKGLADALDETRIEIGDAGLWGSSRTRPRDVVAVLGQVLSTEGSAARRYALMRRSMGRVIPDQRWGISALADPGSAVQVKVGWIQEPTGWVVNSSGRVLVDDSPVLISVMTDGNSTLRAGIAATEAVASTVGEIVRAEREHAEAISRTVRRLGVCLASGQPTSAC